MGRIQLLDDDVVNKIAAGEVVERPASVVKELVENAIDAGASHITVRLEQGGTTAIAVTDDGCGMDEADAIASLKRHTTSKISQADDLFSIATMGFRGEALASIAAVSRLSLTTRQHGDETGTKVTSEDGEVTTIPWNGPVGSTVSVADLFHNVPARSKFLKAPGTEYGHCLELMQALALCHPEVGFTLYHNGKEQLHVVGSKPNEGSDGVRAGRLDEGLLRKRTLELLGEQTAGGLVYVTASSRYGSLEALVSPPGIERGHGKHVFSFVNGRWVKDKTVRYGILRGYHSHLLKGRFPVVVAHLTMDPSLVDVNAHPSKTELRFQYPSEVQTLIAMAIRDRLRAGSWAAPERRAELVARPGASSSVGPQSSFGSFSPSGASFEEPAGPSGGSAPAMGPKSVSTRVRSFDGASDRGFEDDLSPQVWDQDSLNRLLERDHLETGAGQSVSGDDPIPWERLEFVGAFAKCYLFFEADERLLALDQHAFHERILYERLCRDETLLLRSQPLLMPEAVELAPSQIGVLEERLEDLGKRGFDLEVLSPSTVEVRAVPMLLSGRDLHHLMAVLGDDGDDAAVSDTNEDIAHNLLATIACHGAVRSGEELGDNELRQLLSEAATVDFYHNCPHGRRVFRWWNKGQVERWFDR